MDHVANETTELVPSHRRARRVVSAASAASRAMISAFIALLLGLPRKKPANTIVDRGLYLGHGRLDRVGLCHSARECMFFWRGLDWGGSFKVVIRR